MFVGYKSCNLKGIQRKFLTQVSGEQWKGGGSSWDKYMYYINEANELPTPVFEDISKRERGEWENTVSKFRYLCVVKLCCTQNTTAMHETWMYSAEFLQICHIMNHGTISQLLMRYCFIATLSCNFFLEFVDYNLCTQ